MVAIIVQDREASDAPPAPCDDEAVPAPEEEAAAAEEELQTNHN